MSVFLAVLALAACNVISGVIGNWFYDIGKKRGWFPENPTLKRVTIIVFATMPLIALPILFTGQEIPVQSSSPSNTADNVSGSNVIQGDGNNVTVYQTKPDNEEGQSVEALDNGEYLYGVASNPDEEGARYIVFRKEGRVVTGIWYLNRIRSEALVCFKGIIEFDVINIYSEWEQGDYITSSHEPLAKFSPITLDKYRKFSFEDLSDKNIENLRHCVQSLANEQPLF